jgi:hypothetical protein
VHRKYEAEPCRTHRQRLLSFVLSMS